MKIGVVVDGQAESQALWPLFQRIELGNDQLIKPVYADMQPKAAPKQIARAALSRIKFQQQRGAEKIIVLIDLEDRTECPGVFASSIQNALHEFGVDNVEVVVKKYSFENWLIADPEALKKSPKRFDVTANFENAVNPDKADNVRDGANLINSVCQGNKGYHKRDDPNTITPQATPLNIASNSRSFRRFLRVLGFPQYSLQSRLP